MFCFLIILIHQFNLIYDVKRQFENILLIFEAKIYARKSESETKVPNFSIFGVVETTQQNYFYKSLKRQNLERFNTKFYHF